MASHQAIGIIQRLTIVMALFNGEHVLGKHVMQSTPSSTPVIPRVIFVEELSTLIGKTENTIRTCATNKKYQHLIPTPFKLPNSRRLCWYEHDVFAWINTHHHIEPAVKRRPGRPTKAEQIAAQRKSLPTQLLSRG